MKEKRKGKGEEKRREEIAGKIYLIKELPRIGYLVDIEELKTKHRRREETKENTRRIFRAKKVNLKRWQFFSGI